MKMPSVDNVLLMITMSPIASVVTDPMLPDNPIIACNEPFIDLTGYSRPEIIGRNCRFLAGDGTSPQATNEIIRSIDEKRPVVVELLNYRRDGTPFKNAVMIAPIFDDGGQLRYFLGSQVDVTCRDPELQDRKTKARQRIADLTTRQREVMGHIADGHMNKRIAYDLGLSERTIKMHRAALLKRLGVDNNADVIRIAVEAGF